MKLAHLLLVHNSPEQVEVLVNRLHHPDADIYIHLDKKADINEFIYLQKTPNVFFIKNRVNVQWGTFSCVECTLKSIDEIRKSGKSYSYLNLLSGQDLPVKSIRHFHEFLAADIGFSYMHALHVDTEWTEAKERLKYYDIGYFYYGNGRFRISEIFNNIHKRKRPVGIDFYGRSQWFTITMEHAYFVVDYLRSNAAMRRFFQLTWGADELVFQTVLMNSRHRSNIKNNNLRYIDWSEGKPSPKVFDADDKEAIMQSGAFFARKFDLKKSSDIIREIDEITNFTPVKST